MYSTYTDMPNALRKLRIKHNYTQEQLGEFVGVQKAAISKYERGALPIPLKTLGMFCELFSVTADELLGRSQPVSEFVFALPEFEKVPLVGRVHAGEPILADENIVDYIPVAKQDIRSGNYFYMEVEGDCMTGDFIPEGALVLVRHQSSVQNGQIAVVRLEDEVLLRRVKYQDGYMALVPSNPQYEPILITGGNVEIVGCVQEVRFKL